MTQAHAHPLVDETEYLRLEEKASVKHELVNGQIHAMAGAGERHNRITLNIAYHLRAHTRGHHCRAFMADMKLRVNAGSSYYYPDAMLVCDSADDHPQYKQSPCLIAEVLSLSTASIDVREKWAIYRSLPSLRYYLLADSERLWAKLFFRVAGEGWFEQVLSPEDSIEIVCDDLRFLLGLDDLYEDTGLLRL